MTDEVRLEGGSMTHVVRVGDTVRRSHDAAASFDYLPHAGSWIGPIRAPFETICHNDIVPWNTVYRDRMPIALIDWDAAAPGPRAWDLAYAGSQHEVDLVRGGWRNSAERQIAWMRTNTARLVSG